MSSHEIKYCPRCSHAFECKAGNIIQCQCNQIRLSEKEQQFLEEHYTDCLCIKCLDEIRVNLQEEMFRK